MEIRVPVDIMILRALSDGEHANPVRVRYLLGKHHRDDLEEWPRVDGLWSLDYVTQRMGTLRRFELLERVPPDDSGLYRISDVGHVVLQRWLDTRKREFDLPDAIAATNDVEPRAVDPGEVVDDAAE